MRTAYILTGGEDDGKMFSHSDELVKYLREQGVDKDNKLSDDYIFDEAYQLNEFNLININK